MRALRPLMRRRWGIAGVVALVLGLLVAGGVATLAGSGPSSPTYVPHGGAASVISTQAPSVSHGSAAPAFKPAPAAVSAAALLTLPEQVAQLFMVSVDGHSRASAAGLGQIGWGGVVLDHSNFATVAGVARLTRAVRAQVAQGAPLPPLLAATQEGGPQTAFPPLPPRGQAAIGASEDFKLAQVQAILAARRLRALGISMTLAPLADVDIATGALSGRLFSKDPSAVAQLVTEALSGYASAGLIPAVGHFPGSGAASQDPDQMTATVGGTLTQLRARDLVPFFAIAKRAPVILMSNATYAAFDGVTPASLSPQAIKLLRGDLGFEGVVMSDDLDATLQPTGDGPGSVAVQALQAGEDLLYITGAPSEHAAAYMGLLNAAQHSATIRGLVHEALLRVLSLKARYGLLR